MANYKHNKQWDLKLLIIDSGYADFIQEKYYTYKGKYIGFTIYIIRFDVFFDSSHDLE